MQNYILFSACKYKAFFKNLILRVLNICEIKNQACQPGSFNNYNVALALLSGSIWEIS